MLENVDVGERSLESYRGIVPDAQIDELKQQAQDLRGIRVLHLNATPYGGGVSELLRSVVPLLSDLGPVADWQIIGGDERFFTTTKASTMPCRGPREGSPLTSKGHYQQASEANARLLEEGYDIVFIHDPQPAALPLGPRCSQTITSVR